MCSIVLDYPEFHRRLWKMQNTARTDDWGDIPYYMMSCWAIKTMTDLQVCLWSSDLPAQVSSPVCDESVFWKQPSRCQWGAVNPLLVLLWSHVQLLLCLVSSSSVSLWVFSPLSLRLSGHPAAGMWWGSSCVGFSCLLGLRHNSWGPTSAGTLECESLQRLSRKLFTLS